MDNLSKHGILTGIFIIIFLSVMTILIGIKIHDITYLTELYKDFNEYDNNPPPELDIPIAVMVLSLVLIVVTGLMILGIIKERLLFIAPWIILFGIGFSGEIILFVHQLVSYFSAQLLCYMLCILAVQILIFSPIAWIFHGIYCKNKEKYLPSNIQQEFHIDMDLNKT